MATCPQSRAGADAGASMCGARGLSVVAREKLVRERDIGGRAARSRVVKNHGDAVAWRLAQPNVAWNHGRVHLVAKELTDVAAHLLPQVRAGVGHGEQDAF